MNDSLKDLRFDINRIVFQLLIPGIFAVFPFFVLFLAKCDELKIYFKQSEGMCFVALFILSITAGLILEDIGSLIEKDVWDRVNKRKYPEAENEWERYLKLDLPIDVPLIAERYLRTIVVRMKFELSFGVALLIMVIGLILLRIQTGFIGSKCGFYAYCIVVPLILSIYILVESWNSTVLLINTRKKILDRFEKDISENSNCNL